MTRSPLQEALDRGLQPGGDLAGELRELDRYCVSTRDDAEALSEGIARYLAGQPQECSPLRSFGVLFENVRSSHFDDEVFLVLRERGIPNLMRLYDIIYARVNSSKRDEDKDHDTSDLLHTLGVLVLYRNEEGSRRVIDAARKPLGPADYGWQHVFHSYTLEHPYTKWVFETLSNPLPEGFCAVSLLDATNSLAWKEATFPHCFNTEPGAVRLRAWLTNPNEATFSYAQSAARALPFIHNVHREELLALAMNHTDKRVRLEAAWAFSKLGHLWAIRTLVSLAEDRIYSRIACDYLREVNREDAIPQVARDPEFQARAEMCAWLMHPLEFGSPPNQIELYDTREIVWPPTNDRRRVWLFKYTYTAWGSEGEDDVGIGMVGSTTFALFGESTSQMTPEDIYALHCCWELEGENDPRAPSERTAENGRRILTEYNPNGW